MKPTDLSQWQTLVTLLTQCLREGAEGHNVASFGVADVELDRGKVVELTGGSLSKQDAEAFAAKLPFQRTCDGMNAATNAFLEAAAASGVKIHMMRIQFERKRGKWEIARATFQTRQERAAFLKERAAYDEALMQAALKIPTGPWNEIFVEWRDVITDSKKFDGHWEAKGKPMTRLRKETKELRAAYEPIRSLYERHGYKLEVFRFKIAGGPKRAQIDYIKDWYG